MTTCVGEHAVVLGGSIAGLLAARVLADSFTNVTVIERDDLSADPERRRGVPHGGQVHALLPRGRAVLDTLFPEMSSALSAGGAVSADTSAQVRFLFGGHRYAQAPSGRRDTYFSRGHLERHLRSAVRALHPVTIVDGAVGSPIADGGRIVGAQVRRGGEGPAETGEHHEICISRAFLVRRDRGRRLVRKCCRDGWLRHPQRGRGSGSFGRDGLPRGPRLAGRLHGIVDVGADLRIFSPSPVVLASRCERSDARSATSTSFQASTPMLGKGWVLAEFVRYTLADGSEVVFETAESDLVAQHGGEPEVIDGGVLGHRLRGVAAAAEEVAESLREKLAPSELALEFGLKLSGEVNWWFFAKQQAEGTIKVTLKWTRQAEQPTTGEDEPEEAEEASPAADGDGQASGEHPTG